MVEAMRLLMGCALVTCVAIVGCGPSGPEVVPVSGKVTYHGKAVPRLLLGFTPESGRPSSGTTNEQGQFELEYEEGRKGAIVGMHSVSFTYLPKDPGEEMEITEGKRPRPPAIEAILKKYGAANPLKIEIKERTSDLEIKVD